MQAEPEIPTLMTMLFGDQPALAGASPRLLRWCRAFDDWLVDLQRGKRPRTHKNAHYIWKQLLSQVRKTPWEIVPVDIRAYIQSLQEQGRAPQTICFHLSAISSFYRWCGQHHIDPHSSESFNPTKGVPRPKGKLYANAQVLSREQALALLAILQLDDRILTRRDYAFFLARLRFGVPFKLLQQLQWGQIETGEEGAWVHWGAGKERAPLPGDVHRAILGYLRASGRLEGIRLEAYIFAPLADALQREASGQAGEWVEARYLVSEQIRTILKTYGRLAGIPREKLTLPALRHTAAMLRLESGDSVEEIRAFLHHSTLKHTRYYLNMLPIPPRGEGPFRDVEKNPPRLPERGPHHFRPGDNFIHGLYARSQPPEELAAILAEDFQGMADEIAGLRLLCRGLLEMQNQAADAAELALLADAYTLSASRLVGMIKTETELEQRRPEDSWAEQLLAMLVENMRAKGEQIDMDTARELALERDDGFKVFARRVVEEIAATRLSLRRVFYLAMETEAARDRLRLTETYSRGCNRLARLLKAQGNDQGRLEMAMRDMILEGIKEINQEWGLS